MDLDSKGIKPGDTVTARSSAGHAVVGEYLGWSFFEPTKAAIRVFRFGGYQCSSQFRISVDPTTVEKENGCG